MIHPLYSRSHIKYAAKNQRIPVVYTYRPYLPLTPYFTFILNSANEILYFILRPYFVRNKYVPYTSRGPLPRRPTAPNGGPQFGTLQRRESLWILTQWKENNKTAHVYKHVIEKENKYTNKTVLMHFLNYCTRLNNTARHDVRGFRVAKGNLLAIRQKHLL
jgi:hypothetical protein